MIDITLKHDIANYENSCDTSFALSVTYLIDYAFQRFEKRFFAQPDSEIKNLIADKIDSYFYKNKFKIIDNYKANPKRTIKTLITRTEGILSDLPKFTNQSESLRHFLDMKKRGFYMLTLSDYTNNLADDKFFELSTSNTEDYGEIYGTFL